MPRFIGEVLRFGTATLVSHAGEPAKRIGCSAI
jgi:hypothetical protein